MTDTEAKAQALVSIDPKALEHACLCAGRSVHHFDRMGDDLPLRSSIVAHARAIERLEATEARHAAELREQAERFREAVDAYGRLWSKRTPSRDEYNTHFAPFILPAPDPLVEAWSAAFPEDTGVPGMMKSFRAAIEARGGKIVWEETL